MTIPSLSSLLSENDKSDQLFLLRTRIIVNDLATDQIKIKLKSQNVVQEQFYNKSTSDTSQT
ncbi:MAG: hypothetical protein ACPKQO_01445 [Nitrososphaeraceae archaeon]